MEKIRWGIIGTGNISHTFAQGLSGLDDAVLVAVASRTREKAEAFAAEMGAKRAYGTYEELARDGAVDVIYIGVPHTEHYECAMLCIQNGKNVLCEKPFTLNAEYSQNLVAAAQKHNTFLMEAMWTKCLPVIQKVKEWVDQGTIGELKNINASFGFYARREEESRLYNLNLGGGALLDVGIYPIMLSQYLLGKGPDRILSDAVIGPTGVDEYNQMVFCYGEPTTECMANLQSAIMAESGTDAAIYGENGKIVIPDFYRAQVAFRYDTEGNLLETCHIPHKVNGYEYEAMEVGNCLRNGKKESSMHSLKDTVELAAVMDDIRREWGLVYPQEC